MFDLEAAYREVVEMFPKSARVQITEMRSYGKSRFDGKPEPVSNENYILDVGVAGEYFQTSFGQNWNDTKTVKDAAASVLVQIEAMRKKWTESLAAA